MEIMGRSYMFVTSGSSDKLNVPFITCMCQSWTRTCTFLSYCDNCDNKSVFSGLRASVKEIYNNEGLAGFFR